MRTHPAQSSFTAGELSPRLDGRVDNKRYKEGLSILVNGIVRVQGGIERRPGTRFIANTKTHTKKSILIPFEFSDIQAYVIEAGDLYFRFYMNSGQILSGGNPVEVTTPYTEPDLDSLRWVQSADTLYLVHPKYAPRKLTRSSHTSWTLSTIDFVDGPYLDPNTDKTKTLTLSAGTGTGITMTATGHSPFQSGHVGSLWRITFGASTGYVKVTAFTSATQVTVDALGDGVGVLVQSTTGASRALRPATGPNQRLAQGFKAPIVGFSPARVKLRLQRQGTLTDKNVWLEVRSDSGGFPTATVLAVSDIVDAGGISTSAADVEFTFPSPASLTKDTRYHLVLVGDYTQSDANNILWHGVNSDVLAGGRAAEQDNSNNWANVSGVLDFAFKQDTTPDWREGAWSTVRGFPRTITLHDERLGFGATDFQPQTVWLSKSFDWVNFTPGTASADPITFTLASSKVNVIRWLLSEKRLLIGTLGEEFAVSSSSGPLSPSTIKNEPQTNFGSANLKAVLVGSSPLFVQRSGKRVRELVFNFDSDKYVGIDLSLLGEHLFRQYPVQDLAAQREPTQILWAVRTDGTLLGMTYEKTEQVFGWHRHSTSGKFERVAVIPHPNGDRDQVWLIVNRTIGGQTKRYVEVFEDVIGFYETFESDSALQYVGAATSTVTGLSHLEGQTVDIVGDGAVNPQKVVTGGQVTLQKAASVIEVGLPYQTVAASMRPEVTTPDGTAQNRKKRWATAAVRYIDTLGGSLQGEGHYYRSSADRMDAPPSLFTGVKDVNVLGIDEDGIVTMTQSQPLPWEALLLTGVLIVEDS